MKQWFPIFITPYADANVWLAAFDRIEAMQPLLVAGSHGGSGDASMIRSYRDVLKGIGARTKELKAQGISEADIGKQLTDEFAKKYPGRIAPVRVPAAVAVCYRLPGRAAGVCLRRNSRETIRTVFGRTSDGSRGCAGIFSRNQLFNGGRHEENFQTRSRFDGRVGNAGLRAVIFGCGRRPR